ncbi:unnamed protein product [Allacma fusca]|uniref:Uncharacterized protein n=1 Tax=Allacma fusca TaxID=39272 RepID=A0A8J2JPV8_9HEXA|nr:unnamed protein product [Allacma fusca]
MKFDPVSSLQLQINRILLLSYMKPIDSAWRVEDLSNAPSSDFCVYHIVTPNLPSRKGYTTLPTSFSLLN